MGGPLEGFGQAGANDGQVAVFFDHHNGLIPPDFSGWIRRYFRDGWISQNLSTRSLYRWSPIQSTPYMPQSLSLE